MDTDSNDSSKGAPKALSSTDRRPSIVLNDDLTDISGAEPTAGGNATGSGRTRVALKPGHSLMDWLKLCAKSPDLSGTGGQVTPVSVDELQKHNTVDDCWISIRGKVYNVTQYLDFHPGGVDEMMRGAGSDGTDLFNEIHKYVNFESMLKKCFVGPLIIE
ncbi:unnamed protein product [Oppiella nova]|uniref:Cytochrome b5 heme-binding domain-containing protein n=1 Tax=Oppiella nova TaxID=334625 RepID=A0A7R9QDC7_9ACAR|nr:unnamed protein product [Oppiella nova]CAG2163545.1 unnamed protein product [Oppiella nova]